MLYLLLFFIELCALFLLSKKVQRKAGAYLYKLTRNRKIAVYVFSLMFLPGTFVHEMSHFLAALFLLVPVGNLELIPKIEENSVKLGSVGIGKTDFVRRFLIGTAPFAIGTILILVLTNAIFDNFPEIDKVFVKLLVISFGMYLMFTVSNTMFSSKKDLEGMWVFLVFVLLILLILWIIGIKIELSAWAIQSAQLFERAAILLLFPLALDVIFLFILKKV